MDCVFSERSHSDINKHDTQAHPVVNTGPSEPPSTPFLKFLIGFNVTHLLKMFNVMTSAPYLEGQQQEERPLCRVMTLQDLASSLCEERGRVFPLLAPRYALIVMEIVATQVLAVTRFITRRRWRNVSYGVNTVKDREQS